MGQRSAGEVDAEIGRRLRSRRLELGMSQEVVAEALGVTFQQLQKYEKGINRVSASKLCRLAEILETHPEALLPRLASLGRASGQTGKAAQASSTRARAVVDAFVALDVREQRSCLLALMATLMPADADASDASGAKRSRK